MANKSGWKSLLTKLDPTDTSEKPATVRSSLSYYSSSIIYRAFFFSHNHLRCTNRDRDDFHSLFLTLLVNPIDYSRVTRDFIKPLMVFFCHQYYEGSYSKQESAPLIEGLMKLWHKAHTFPSPVHNTSFNKLFACMLLPHCYEGTYCMTANAAISSAELMILITAYEEQAKLSRIEEKYLAHKIMFLGTSDPKKIQSLLVRLNQCMAQFHLCEPTSHHYFSLIRQLLKPLELLSASEHDCLPLFNELCRNAKLTLKAAQGLGLFVMPLHEEEKQVAILLLQKDTQGLMQWIEHAEKQPLSPTLA